jgi:HSP20 family protein
LGMARATEVYSVCCKDCISKPNGLYSINDRMERRNMAETVPIRKTSSVFDQMREMQDRIMRRAYELFEQNGCADGRDFENWTRAERELYWRPAIELSEENGQFELQAAIAGVEAKDINIEVTTEDVMLTAEIHHESERRKGTVLYTEFEAGKMFRSIHLPQKINPDSVKAEFRNGLLRMTAEIAAEERARKLTPEAA